MNLRPQVSRRALLGYVALASAAMSGLALGACRAAPKTLSELPILHVNGTNDDSPALNHLLSGGEVLWNGRRVQFDRKPPPGSYFLAQTITAPAGSELSNCVFYAWTRPAIILHRGAIFTSCWTCLSPDPFVTGRFTMEKGIVRLY